MKKLGLLILIGLVMTSCYDPYRVDYDYSTVAFSSATGSANTAGVLGRTVVKGEGLNLDIGINLGGVIDNEQEHWAEYEIDPSLLNGTNYEMLPSNYYTLSDDNRFVIPSGEHVGRVNVQLDSTNFVTDTLATSLHYALPIRLTATSADSIIGPQSTKIVAIKYINKYAGFYNQTGTFTTFDASGNQINSGNFENVIEAETIMLDTVRTNGLINQRGDDYQMDIAAGDNVTLSYYPNPNPPTVSNLGPESAISTSYVSGWESLEAVADGFASSSENPKYGNWNQGGSWQWIEYEFPNFFTVDESDVWWWTDGGGLQAATDSYLSYLPQGEEENFVEIPNTKFGEAYDQYNSVEFDPTITNTMRLNIIHDAQSVGVSEWRVFGLPAPVTPEQASIADMGTTSGTNTFNPETATFTLNYRVNFENGGYTVVEAELVWRNRIRDGVNEWRR